MKKAIIFDMDGTLVDSSITIVNAINYVRGKLDLKALETNLILEKVNDPDLDPAQYFYEVPAFTPQHEAWFSNYYTDNHEKELQLYSGVEALLERLKNRGFKLAIATNSYRGSTTESLSHLNIIDYFQSLACYDDVGRGKPAPDMLEKNLKDLELNPEDTVFVGDSERDLLASKSANIDYIMINWGFSDYEDAIHNIDALEKAILEA